MPGTRRNFAGKPTVRRRLFPSSQLFETFAVSFFSATLPQDLTLFGLGAVRDSGNNDAVSANAIEDGIRSAADDQLADTRFRADAPQIRMNSQSFHNRDEACSQAFCSIGLVQGNEGANFLKASERQRRPDDCQRATFCRQGRTQLRGFGRTGTWLWNLPQTHLGGGNSWSVPQESNQTFMSS